MEHGHQPAAGPLERFFKLSEHGTNTRTELIAGRYRDISTGAWFLALIFIAKFALM